MKDTIKKALVAILAFALAIGTVAFAPSPTEAADLPFTDISSYGWARDGIQYVYDCGLMKGTTATTFDPAGNIKRCDTLVTLWRLAGEPDTQITGTFSDVYANNYFAKAVEWAVSTDIFFGYDNGKFKPLENATRQDFAIMIYNTCEYLGRPSLPGDDEAYKAVADYDKISDYALEAVKWCYSNGIMGQGSLFKPDQPISRAEAAIMISRMIKNTEPKEKDVINILMMGIDYHSYSDATILVSINKTDKKIVFTSLLRDVFMEMNNLGMLKFNNAFRFGGPKATARIIEKEYGVHIDNYAFVKFNQMANIFDALGGLDIDVKEAEVEGVNNLATEMQRKYKVEITPGITSAGISHLDGYHLMGYCRVRKGVGNGDFDRTARQRVLFTKMFEKIKTMSFPDLLAFFVVAMPNVKHNLKAADFSQLIRMLPTLCTYTLETQVIPEDGNYYMDPLLDYALTGVDFRSASTLMKQMIYG